MFDETNPGSNAEVSAALQKNKALPFIDADNLMAFMDQVQQPPRIARVEVHRIISAQLIDNWGDIELNPNRIEQILNAVQSGKLDLDKIEPPSLFELGGAYAINADGRHRVAVAKILGLKDVRAEVYPSKPEKVMAFSEDDYEIIKSRLEQGLWIGAIEPSANDSSRAWGNFYASGPITDYEGMWVFSRNMERAREVYQTVGASGKPSF
jgi:hypothetical protein